MTRTYLVTGAVGFLGAHLTRLLSSQGHRVVAVDLGLQPDAEAQCARIESLPGVRLVLGDLADPSFVAELPAVDGVYHLAALNGTANFYSRPWDTVWHSTIPTLLLLEHFARLGTGFFFYAGSSEAYAGTVTTFGWPVPTAENVPLSIQDPRELRWSYGGAKLHGEIASFAAAAQLGLPVVVGRFHNAYGPHMGVHHVIPDFIERGRRGVFELHGARQTRSFIYVDDAVRAMTVVAEHALGEVVNIGSPDEVVIADLAQIIMRQAGWRGEIVEHPAPSGSVERRAPDVTRLSELMDVAEFVSLDEGISRTLPSYLDAD
ncbi:MAG: epimerase [Archangium gephyra]|uniref:Epimerase n=1 Tax=Archangium gephyra TaxID=48 RepID=A0A2W5UHW3_9BACT|nr:MAG: epimerase [Archangium gephyra]